MRQSVFRYNPDEGAPGHIFRAGAIQETGMVGWLLKRLPKSRQAHLQSLAPRLRVVAVAVIQGVPKWRRWFALSLLARSNAVLVRVPDDALDKVVRALVARNAWPGLRFGHRALQHDLWVLATQLDALEDDRVVHEKILLAALPILDRCDKKLLGFAIAAQIAGAVAALILSRFPEWVVVVQAAALFISAVLVGECEHVDARVWARLVSAATGINIILSIVVMRANG